MRTVAFASLLALAACRTTPPPTPMTTAQQPPSWPALDEKLLADAAATYNFRLGHPAALAVTPDGSVLFRRTGARSFAADLYELRADGSVRTLATAADLLGTGEENLSAEEKARRERTRTATRGVVDIGVSDDGATVMVPLGGVFHLIDRASGKRSVLDPKGAAYDPRLSPDGKTIAFVRDDTLWAMTATRAPYQLVPRAHDYEQFGVADFAAQEELRRTRGFWWSPDSTRILYERIDNRPIDTLYVADPRHNDQKPTPFKYPRAGTPNAKVGLAIIDANGKGKPRELAWDAKYEYLVSVDWSRTLPTALVIDRDQQALALVEYGATPRVVLTETDAAWLNVDLGAPQWTDDGFVWMTEASGEWILELRDTNGKVVRALTEKGFGLRRLVDVEDGFAIVEASADPLRQDVYRVPLAGGAPVKLTTSDGVASGGKAGHGVIVVDTSLASGGKRAVAITAAGTRELPSVAETPSLVPTTKLETVQLSGRTHHVAITRPRNFDASKRYPVLLKVYGGPHAVTVVDARDSYVMDQWYADAGFIVVRSDNRGTPHRGREWERAILKDLITVPLEDQVGALQAVGARYRELDLARVGVYGWSFGGYLAAMAVLLRPDVFHAAVAGAPVTDWALYDTAYTERYMKTPQQNPEGYKHTSALTHAATLQRPLLLIHGTTDDNVHLAHSLALIEALFVAAKRAEVITLSGTHMVPDPKLNLAREKVQVDFFRDHLK